MLTKLPENVAPEAPLTAPQYKAYRGAHLDVAAPGVLADVSQAHGRVTASLAPQRQTKGGAVELASDGSFRFTPADTGAEGSFQVVASDDQGASVSFPVTIAIGAQRGRAVLLFCVVSCESKKYSCLISRPMPSSNHNPIKRISLSLSRGRAGAGPSAGPYLL